MMDERTMLTIIETLAKALEEEKILRAFFESREKELMKELAEKEGQGNG